MQGRYWSYILHSLLVNLLGIGLITGLGLWDFAIWLIAPLFFYWVTMFLTTVRIRERSIATSVFITLSLLFGHALGVSAVFLFTLALGRWLGSTLPRGVEFTEMLLTNSVNSILMGGLIATIGSFLLVQYYFSGSRETSRV